MKRLSFIAFGILMMAVSIVSAEAATKPVAADSSAHDALSATISKLDADLFHTFNHCASPDQLQKHASYLASNLEFYHDKGGVTWSRNDYMAKTKSNVCGKFRRELVPGSLQVFPIKDYGALEQGTHKFCRLKSGKCFGEARFLIVWHHMGNRWVATRMFSYGHNPIN